MSKPLLEVATATYELTAAATGHPIVVRTLDGQNVLLRLATPDEIQQYEQESRAHLEAQGLSLAHPPMSRQRAEDLCRPLA